LKVGIAISLFSLLSAKYTGYDIHFMGEQTEEERVSVMSKNIIDGLRYAYEAYCRGDIEGAVDAIDVDPNILWIEPKEFYAGGTYRGRQGVIDYLTLAYAATEQVQNVPEEILVVGDKIAVFLHFQAWPKGGGEPREGHIADVYTVLEGKIVQMQAYADPAEARKAIGSPHQ
jgi:ketosteroid isomerase-like protein